MGVVVPLRKKSALFQNISLKPGTYQSAAKEGILDITIVNVMVRRKENAGK